MNFKKVKIVTFIPTKDADRLRDALGKAGAGVVGEYTFCSYSSEGIGRFKPSTLAHPHVGQAGKLEEVHEERVEVLCGRADAQDIINVLRKVHPYEEIAFDIIPLLEESDL